MIPGWPYSFVTALEPGRTSWTALLDVLRVRPSDDHTDVAATQLRTVVDTLITAGHWREGDPEIWIIGDSGYDGPRLAFLLTDLPIRVLVRMRSDRVLAFPAPPRRPGTRGRSARHGARFAFPDPATRPPPAHATTTHTSRYGDAHSRSWDRLHPTLTRTGAWTDHDGPLPIMEGTVGIGDTIRVSLSAPPVEEVKTGSQILASLGLRPRQLEIVSCPSCGRAQVDVYTLTEQVTAAFEGFPVPLRVAVMGCVVNGPGEAREADLGVSSGNGKGQIFVKGRVVKTVPEHRWVIDRTIAWLFGYRRPGIRYERNSNHFCAFLTLAAALACYKKLPT
jgi:hypothetical protein